MAVLTQSQLPRSHMAPPTPPNESPSKDRHPAHPDSTHDPLLNSTAHKNLSKSEQITKGNNQPQTRHNHIWLITGPAGCGKTTVAKYIANAMNLPYLEGDDYHPKKNVEKMSRGEPLTDEDRWGWLETLRNAGVAEIREQQSQGVVMTCSALKRRYRDVLRVARYWEHSVYIHFVYLHADEKVLMERVGARKGHYMGANMVHSQFASLEEPQADETDVIKVDVSGSIEDVEKEAIGLVRDAIKQQLEKDSEERWI